MLTLTYSWWLRRDCTCLQNAETCIQPWLKDPLEKTMLTYSAWRISCTLLLCTPKLLPCCLNDDCWVAMKVMRENNCLQSWETIWDTFDPGLGRFWRGIQTSLIFLAWESHGLRLLAVYSLWAQYYPAIFINNLSTYETLVHLWIISFLMSSSIGHPLLVQMPTREGLPRREAIIFEQ